MLMIPARPVYPPRSGRSTRSGPVRQDMFFVDVVCLEQKWVWRSGIIVARR
jgi:hypothetical protein